MSEYQKGALAEMFRDTDVWHKSGLTSRHFTDGFYRLVFDAVSSVIEAGEPVNLITVKQRVPDIDTARLAAITDYPTGNWQWVVKQVHDEARRHHLHTLLSEAREHLDHGEPIDAVYSYIEDGLVKIALSGVDDVRLFADGIRGYVDQLEYRFNHRDELPGITTGFEHLDAMFGGFEAGKLYYIGARPSQGKSALLLNFMVNAARAGSRCGLISLESSEREAYARIFAQTQRLENSKLRMGVFSRADFSRITDAATEVTEWPVWICDNPELTLSETRTVARKMVVAHHVDILFVDYLQYIREDDVSVERRDHVASASRGLKAIARQLGVPVVCAAQLRRDADGRRPMLGDFAESSQVEKDADMALLLHQWIDAGEEHHEFLVEKNRDGRTGSIPVIFDKEFAKFRVGG